MITLQKALCMRCISLLFLIFLFSCNQDHSNSNSLLDYIPDNSAVLLKVHSLSAFQSALKNNDFLKKQKQTALQEAILDQIQQLDFFQSSAQGLLAFSRMEDSIPDIYYITQDSLYLFNESPEIKKETITSNKRNYDLYIKGEDSIYSLTYHDKLILSSSKKLIEQGLFVKKKLISEKLLRLYQIAHSKKNTTLFIDPQQKNAFITSPSKDSVMGIPSFFSDWVSLDLSLDQK